jgi:hypothetical protein
LFGTFFLSSFGSVWEKNIVKKEGLEGERKKEEEFKERHFHTTNLKVTDFPRVCEH